MGRPARPNVPGSRPYTGYDGTANGITGGLAQWIIEARRTSEGLLTNLGAYGVRPIRGKGKTSMSVHSTGRAVDLSFARRAAVGPQPLGPERRRAAIAWLDRIIEANAELGVEACLDYFPSPHGRGWFCDRQKWTVYQTKTIAGAPGGTWFHIEIAPDMAKAAARVRQAFTNVFPEIPRIERITD